MQYEFSYAVQAAFSSAINTAISRLSMLTESTYTQTERLSLVQHCLHYLVRNRATTMQEDLSSRLYSYLLHEQLKKISDLHDELLIPILSEVCEMGSNISGASDRFEQFLSDVWEGRDDAITVAS